MDFRREVKQLLTEWGPGQVMQTAYDTAWVARLGEIDGEMSSAALQWISENQLPDGSWGAAEPFYYHDRVISTIAAMIALTRMGRRVHDRKQIEPAAVQRGLHALERIAGGATQGLMADPIGATVGFEMIVPTLVAEAESLGILDHQGSRILGRLTRMREAKMARLNGFRINRGLTIAYSAEMAGLDCQHLLDLEHLQEDNGSVAYSPSATAYYAGHVRPGDPAALAYLRRVVKPSTDQTGAGAPIAAPFDVYERAWVLWNLALAVPLDAELRELCEPHLAQLAAAWKAKRGVGFGAGYSVQDGDDTSLVYAVLTAFGCAPDLDAVYYYEEPDHFRCYALEANPSVSANVHILDVFRRVGLDAGCPAVQKIIHFLRENQINGFWIDKWHASPYYTTAHVAIALSGYAPDLAESAIRWILQTRHADGSWGFYMPTAEETAYALQALCLWRKSGGSVPRGVIETGAAWLEEHAGPPYPPLWIAKSLYYSEWVVRSEVLSALILAAQNGSIVGKNGNEE